MSKIIKMTPEYADECRKELDLAIEEFRKNFEETLRGEKIADGKICLSKTININKGDGREATLYFTPEAWTKMVVLIQEFSKEVAWHGLAKRSEDEEKDEYTVYDILVYPQEVTGATVNTDQEAYETWLMNNDDDVFNNIRMQGHSHVNMGTSPSSVDTTHQEKILEQLEDDMFYIFMIWNKSFNHNIKIYDLKKNVMFEDGDVTVKLSDGGIGLDEFVAEAKSMVKDKVYTQTSTWPTPYNPLAYNSYNNTQANTAKDKKSDTEKQEDKPKGKPKVQIGAGWGGRSSKQFGCYGYDDDDDLYGAFGAYGR